MKRSNSSHNPVSQNTARESAIRQTLDLVNRIARAIVRRLPPCVTLDDLTGAGMIGLIQAADRFNNSRGLEFRTYAQHRIRGAMQDFLRNEDPLSRTERRRVRGTVNAPGTTVNVSLDLVSLSQAASQPDLTLRSEIRDARRCLSAQENLVIALIYDFDWNNREVAAELNVTEGRVSQIKQHAIAKLRRRLITGIHRRAA